MEGSITNWTWNLQPEGIYQMITSYVWIIYNQNFIKTWLDLETRASILCH